MSHLRGLVALVIAGFASAQFGCTSYPSGVYGPPSLPPSPIYTTITAPPNVMLINDGSINARSAIYDAGYDPNTIYPDWSYNGTFWPINNNPQTENQIRVGGLWESWFGADCTSGQTGPATGVGGQEKYRIGMQRPNPTTLPNNYIYKCLKITDPYGNGDTYYSANYLNYIFQTYGQTNAYTFWTVPPAPRFSTPPIPNATRLSVSQELLSMLVGDPLNSNVRFCYGPWVDWGIDSNSMIACALQKNDSANSLGVFQGTVKASTASTGAAKLGSAHYNAMRYLRGMTSYSQGGGPFRDTKGATLPNPISTQYRCTANYILMVTGGMPQYDDQFPSSTGSEPLLYNADTRYVDSSNGGRPKLPDYDGLKPYSSWYTFPAGSPAFSDGLPPDRWSSDMGNSNFIDDLALFGSLLNIPISGNDAAGKPFNDSAFLPRNIDSVLISMAHGSQLLDDAAYYGGTTKAMQVDVKTYFLENTHGLFWQNKQQLAAGTSTTATTGSLNPSTKVFQAAYNTVDWSGRLYAYSLATGSADSPCTGTAGTVCSTPDWEAGAVNDKAFLSGAGGVPANRKVYTWNGSSGVVFAYANLSAAQKAALDTNPNSIAYDGLGSARLDWMKGDQSNEQGGSGTGAFRKRTHLLGDIVSSNPFFVGTPSFNYSFDHYIRFRQTYYQRTQAVYAAGNDGMLHAFNAASGKELFAYVPSAAYGSAAAPLLSRPSGLSYPHRFIVDGPLTSNDAYSSSWGSDDGWRTVLVGTGGSGSRGVYALNVTNPASFTGSNVMWEFTSADDPDLGYVLGQPAIVRMPNGRWAAIVTSGYLNDNAAGQAAVFILFLDHTGSSWTRSTSGSGGDYIKILIPNPSGSGLSASAPNGLAAPVVIDRDQNGYADGIYFGDVAGDLWKVDVSSASQSDWAVAYNGSPLFVAKDSTGTRQPITQRPNVGYNNNGSLANNNNNVMLYFGTGRLLDLDDINSTSVQSFYGVFDNNWATLPTNISRSTMLQQTLANAGTSRTLTSLTYTDVATQYGFYMDLPTPGEFQIQDPVLIAGMLYFTTMYLNNADPCATVFAGYLMVVSAKTGGGINSSQRFDTNNDGLINSTDSSASGIQLSSAPLTSPAVIDLGNGNSRLVGNTFNGDSYSILTSTVGLSGRQTWREFLP